jgi:NADH-quinone oxidoreductase subunit J
MVTHPKPVFAALYFVLVVLSSAGLFLVLQAEFMAFALIIVYAGAILITYMFVLMLAQQSQTDGGHDIEAGTLYDRLPREPLAAVAVGFLLLATLGDALFSPRGGFTGATQAKVVDDANLARWLELRMMPRRVDQFVEAQMPGGVVATDERGPLVDVAKHGSSAAVRVQTVENGVTTTTTLTLPPEAAPTNTQSVGLALVSRFPASLELASVILLMAMFGAAVLARKQIELGEDERREAAGMRRISVDEPEPPSSPGIPITDLAGSRGGRA